jgi:hypothetical protein
MSELYKKVENFVRESFGNKHGMIHFERTVYWIKQLNPDADEALLIAGIAHDIERAFRKRGGDQERRAKELGYTHIEFLRHHEEEGARIIGEFLEKNSADKDLIDRVKMLVSRHEEGGKSDDLNILKDADSISYFENNISHFLEHRIHEGGKENVRKKFEWTYSKITSKRAKEIVRPWYEKAMKDIENK